MRLKNNQNNILYYFGIAITILSLYDIFSDNSFVSILLFAIGFGMVITSYER